MEENKFRNCYFPVELSKSRQKFSLIRSELGFSVYWTCSSKGSVWQKLLGGSLMNHFEKKSIEQKRKTECCYFVTTLYRQNGMMILHIMRWQRLYIYEKKRKENEQKNWNYIFCFSLVLWNRTTNCVLPIIFSSRLHSR